MSKYSISKSFKWRGQVTAKVAAVMRMFGLDVARMREKFATVSCEIDIRPGDIVYITGPSGAGKSVLLKELERCVPASDRINLGQIELPVHKSLIDCIGGDVLSALKVLSTAGLNDVYCVLNQTRYLSEGQKYRFRLACALASGKRFIFADEFCSNLDRITAAVISYTIGKFAKRKGVTFVLASSHDDLLMDLEPDVIVTKDFGEAGRVVYKR